MPDEAVGWLELSGKVIRTGEPIRFQRGMEVLTKPFAVDELVRRVERILGS